MKLIHLFILVFLVQVACSQENVKITKVRSSGKEIYRCQELFFKDSSLIYELYFSHNGWQITDSISYNKQDSVNCAKIYFATYDKDSDSTSTPHYEYRYLDCNRYDYLKTKSFSRIHDTYSLLKSYLSDLCLLLEAKPDTINPEFRFKKPIIPSVLTKYGIPYNEQLSSFSFKLNDSNKLILKDTFAFENYIVSRTYSYQGDILEQVLIQVTNRENGQISNYYEVFKL